MKKTFDLQFDVKEEVYLKTVPGDMQIVTGIVIRDSGLIMYELTRGDNSTWHYACEIMRRKKIGGFRNEGADN
jgi:hypothetical protein